MFCEYTDGEQLQKTPPLKFVKPLISVLMQDLKSFLEKKNAGKIPRVFTTSTGRMFFTVLESMNLPKIFAIEKLKLEEEKDLEPLWIWIGHPEEAPTTVIYLVGPMSKMKEKILK